ncbi:MAG: hypothetical protein QM703_16560 [Gemmatales bacterium]
MTKPRLRRWHFDLAFFVGLLLFGLSYWFIAPRPKWVSRIPTDPTVNMSAGSLGYSSDGQFYFTIKDTTIVGNHLPKPMIQRWNVKTGELLEEYPLQMPADDVAYLKPRPRGEEHFILQTVKLPDQNVIYTVQTINDARRQQVYRLYDLTSGECITKQTSLILPTHLWYLPKKPQDGHHWGCYVKTYEPEEPVQFVDLTTGETLHTLAAEKNMRVHYVSPSKDLQYIMILWSGPLKEQKTVQPVLGIYRLGTWECTQQISLPLQPQGVAMFDTRESDCIELKYITTMGKDPRASVIRFRRNSQTNLFEQQGEVTVGSYQDLILSSTQSIWREQNTIRVEQRTLKDNRQPPEPFLTINNSLTRFGISIWRPRTEQEFYVYELQSGKLLRQITGLTEMGNAGLQVNSTGHYLAGVKSSEGRNWTTDYSLYLYEIPHHLWERTLRWTMYLSWLLVIPWPFRYLVRPVGHAVRDSP